MWQSYFNGLGLGAGLIMAIGAQNLFVLTQGLRREHPLTAALVCVICDCLLICAGVFGLARLLASEPLLLTFARWGGALFLIGYASCALYRACHPGRLEQSEGKALRSRRTVLLTTLAVTLLNPHVYLDTVVLLGSLGSAHAAPAAFAVGAMSASLVWFFCLALCAARLAPWLAQPRVWRAIDLLVALMLLAVASQLILTPAGTG